MIPVRHPVALILWLACAGPVPAGDTVVAPDPEQQPAALAAEPTTGHEDSLFPGAMAPADGAGTGLSGESDPGEQEIVPPFAEALEKLDADGNGKLSKDEVVDERAKERFDEYLDLDDSGFLEERDWSQFRSRRQGMNSLWAYRAGGRGDVTETNLLWKNPRTLPNVPSPLVYRGVLYTLKEGGIFTSFDLETGEILKQGRLQGAPGAYYSSPVASDGKIYAVSEEGKVAVIRAGRSWELLGVNPLDDGSKSTPAIAGGSLYLRTYSALYCFRQLE